MSRRSGRTSRSRVALLVAAMLAAVSLAPVVHSDVERDADCTEVLVVHDASRHVFTAAPGGDDFPSAEHCVLCHLFRASRGSATSQISTAPVVVSSRHSRVADHSLVVSPVAVPLPARAPPIHI